MLNTSVDLHCWAAVTGMDIEHKRWPTMRGSCEWHGYWTQALTYIVGQLWRAWILDTSVDLPCGTAMVGMAIGHKRWPTMWGSCEWHGYWTQALTYLVGQLWRAWLLDTSDDLPCGATVNDMDIGHKRWPPLWDTCDWHGYWTQALTSLVGHLWLAWILNTSVDLHCRAAVTGIDIGHKRWPTLLGNCNWQGYWTQALTSLVGQLWLAWILDTSVDLHCGAAVAGMVQEWLHKRWPTLWGSWSWHGAGMVTQALTYIAGQL